MSMIQERIEDMRVDKLDLYNKAYSTPVAGIPGTWVGHQEQAAGWQQGLRNLIDRAKNHRPPCPIPAGARRLAWQTLPTKPRGK